MVTVDYDREDRLGNVPWLIDITSETTVKPNLILNKSFLENELKQKIFTGSGIAQTLILVQIIRDVLKYLLIQQSYNIQNIDSIEGWQKIWLMWARDMSPEEYPQTDSAEMKTHWIEDLLDEYCRKMKLIKYMKNELAGS